MTDEVASRWWWGPAATVGLGAVAVLAAGVNAAVGGAEWSAYLVVGAFTGALAVGYTSLVPLYLDVRRVRAATDYSPRYWLYLSGALVLSPVLACVVYLHNRRKHLS